MGNDWIPIDDSPPLDNFTQYEVTFPDGSVGVALGRHIDKNTAIAVRGYSPAPYVPPTPIDHSELWRGCVGAWCPSLNTKMESGWRLLKKGEIPAAGDCLSIDGIRWIELNEACHPRQKDGIVYRRRVETGIDPEPGWRLLEEDEPKKPGDQYKHAKRAGMTWSDVIDDGVKRKGTVYRRRIEAEYRPFANAAEFEPHRSRWTRVKDEGPSNAYPPKSYNDKRVGSHTYEQALKYWTFEDGTPFGVEVMK